MSREADLFLEDIADRTSRIQRLVGGRSFQEFGSDDALHEAVLRHLTVIGEAVKNLPSILLDTEPEIPWRKVAKLRDILIHVYFGVKDEIIWGIVEQDIEPLGAAVRRMLEVNSD